MPKCIYRVMKMFEQGRRKYLICACTNRSVLWEAKCYIDDFILIKDSLVCAGCSYRREE